MRAPEQLVRCVMVDFIGTPLDYADVQLVLRRNDRSHPMSGYCLAVQVDSTDVESQVGEPETPEPELTVAVAEALQTLVMDESGKPWPQVTNDQRTVVIEPHLNREGVPVWGWLAGGEDYCAVGDLGQQGRQP